MWPEDYSSHLFLKRYTCDDFFLSYVKYQCCLKIHTHEHTMASLRFARFLDHIHTYTHTYIHTYFFVCPCYQVFLPLDDCDLPPSPVDFRGLVSQRPATLLNHKQLEEREGEGGRGEKVTLMQEGGKPWEPLIGGGL